MTFLRLNFQKKILYACILVVFLPFTAALLIFTKDAAVNTERNNSDFMIQINDQISNSIDMIISDIDNITFLYMMDNDIIRILNKDYIQNDVEFVEDLWFMNSLIYHSTSTNPYIIDITIIARNGKIYSNAGIDDKYLEQLAIWTKEIDILDGRRMLSHVYNGFLSRNEVTMMTLGRKLVQPTVMNMGYVCVDINIEAICNELYKRYDKEQISNSLIIQDNKVIYDSMVQSNLFNNDDLQTIINYFGNIDNLANPKTIKLKIGPEEYYFVGTWNETTDWAVIQYIPDSYVREGLNRSIRFYLTSISTLILLMVFLSYFLSKGIAKPINKLIKAMKNGESGILETIHMGKEKKDEIGVLIKAYNNMITRLKESIKKEYVAQINQKKMEQKMLQAQINPHFLYNTLNLISSIAKLEDIPVICAVANNLSEMFRYNIKEKNIVQIKDEIEQIKNYINIQQLRFPNKFLIKYNIPEELNNCCMLKFLLQPIVENAICHGIEKKKGIGEITITVKDVMNDLEFKIEDNGIGIEPQIVEKLNGDLHKMEQAHIFNESQESIGISNVHVRIYNFYGSEYGVKVSSSINHGTCIIITIPKLRIDDLE